MLLIEDIIKEVDDGRTRTRTHEAEGITWHRCGIDRRSGAVLGFDGRSICNAFSGRVTGLEEAAHATGSENPYTILFGGDCGPTELDGKIWQALALYDIGPHAKRWSAPTFGFGLIFDGRIGPPSAEQYQNAVELSAAFCSAHLWDPYRVIKGHGELPGATKSKRKGQPYACPGDFLDMDVAREDVALAMGEAGKRRLYDLGVVFR